MGVPVVTRGTSLAGVLTSAPPWTKLLSLDGSSVAGLSDIGANTWASTGSAIEVTRVDNNPSYLLDAAAVDEFAPLIAVQAEVMVLSTSMNARAGIALVPDPSTGPESPDTDSATLTLGWGAPDAIVYPGSAPSAFTAPLDAWVTLRMDVAFGVARFAVDGVVVGSSWLGNQWFNNTKYQGFSMGYPALYADFNGSVDGPLFRNVAAWTSNPGPFS